MSERIVSIDFESTGTFCSDPHTRELLRGSMQLEGLHVQVPRAGQHDNPNPGQASMITLIQGRPA